MAGIDDILAGTGGNTRADFSGLFSGPVDAYNSGRDQKAKNDLRDAFKGGVPLTADGQPDFASMAKTLFQKGGLSEGTALIGAAIGPTERAKLDSIDAPQGQSTLVSPPSSNRQASTVVAPPLNKGGEVPQGDGQPQGSPQQPTVMTVLAAQGIPNDQLGAASASIARQLGTDPTAPLNLQDPQVRNVLAPAIAQLKRQGIGQVQPQAQPQMAQAPQPLQASPDQQAAQNDPLLKKLTLLAGSPDKAVAAAAQTRLKSYLASKEPTTEIKNYNFATANPGMDERSQENATAEARGKVQGETYAKKYESLIESGTKAQQEIPQLQMLQEQMNDPNFFSGIGEKYNYAFKQLKSAVGIDPNAAVPQEFLRKATAANVLGGLGALKGLGQIRVAEISLAKDASAAPNTSVPANKLLTEMAIRTHQRNADIADMAQAYSQKNGGLDAGFDKIATEYGKSHPLFSDAEIKDWTKAIGQSKTASAAPSVPGAKQAPDGNFYVPDPKRPGKYLKVVQ